MSATGTADDGQDGPAESVAAARPHAERISALFVERAKAMSAWGCLYWTVGPTHPETTRHEKQINDLAAAILRLQQEGTR